MQNINTWMLRGFAGMLGVMTQLTLKLDPAYRLRLVEQSIATADWREALVDSGPMSFIHASPTDQPQPCSRL